MSNSLHRNTPTLKATDPRGLAVRTVEYHRQSVTQAPQARVTRQVFGASGFLSSQWDPRQCARGSGGVASQSNIFSLSGETVRTESADAGWRLILRGEAGQPLHTWDSRQAHQEQRYDRLLRPVAVFEQTANEPRPRCVERLAYGAAEVAGNRCGRLIRHADPAGVVLMDEYGIGGNVIKQTRRFRMDTSAVDWPSSDDNQAEQLETKAHTTTWRYDALGALLEQIDARGNRRHWRYGRQGWLQEVALTLREGTRQVLMNQRVYNASGLVESERLGNEVTKVAKYAAEDNRLLQLTVYRKGEAIQPLQDLVYEYDPVGNILSLSDQAQPTQWHSNARIDAVSRYQYDSLYQLTQASGRENAVGSGGQAAPGRVAFGATGDGLWRNYTQHYTYDEHGNLTRLRHVASSGAGYTRDMSVAVGSNRALSVTDGAAQHWATMFDANGNQQSLGGGQRLGWNVRNQLTHATQVRREQGDPDVESYLYDGQGQRAAKIRSQRVAGKPHTLLTCYLPGLHLHVQPGKRLNVLEIDTGGGRVTVLQWEHGRPSDMSAEQLQFSILDHLSSSLLELDEHAQLLSQEHYYPYGMTAWWATNDTQRANYKIRRYAGKERDATGLYYYGYRYYAPWLQRWISPDPLGDVDGLNLYAMALGNPLRFRDVDGGQTLFGEQFQPSRGDILFGLANTVRIYRSFWSKLTARGDIMAAYVGIDEIGPATAALAESVSAHVRYGLGRMSEARYRQTISEQGVQVAQQFYGAVVAKYSGCTSTTANREFAKKFVSDLASGDYSFERTLEDYIDVDLIDFQHKLVSRISKSALKTLTAPESMRHVHFALDDLDLNRVIDKSQSSATGSELRWLYRHRQQLAGRVTFYRHQQRVDAPWESNSSAWRSYKPASSRASRRAVR